MSTVSVSFRRLRRRFGVALAGRLSTLLLPVFLPALLAGCADEYPQSTINPHSDFAEIIHSLYVSVFWWTMLILAVVWVLMAWVVVKYRRRSEEDRPRQIRGHLGAEIGWTVGPAIIVIAIAIPTIQAVFATQRSISEDALLVEVTAHQFWWEFHYPEEGVRTANELWVPVDRPVSLRLESTDVIHSFWVPMLGGKRDVNPVRAVRDGQDPRYGWLYFTPTETGVFHGQCAEFCGEAHAFMGKRVVVAGPDEFQDWVDRWHASEGAALPEADPEAQESDLQMPGELPPEPETVQALEVRDDDARVTVGRELFLNSTCIACHAIQGTNAQGVVGPNLTLFGERTTIAAGRMATNEENLVRWIMHPQDVKPGARMPGVDSPGGNWPATGFSEEEARAIAAYLLSLR